METLADLDAVLVIDETGFLKQGKASCGVARQYTGSAGKITNCQIGVFASYVSRHGHAFIDRALYLPKAWTEDRARLARAHVPESVGFATKPAIALSMIERAIGADVPFSWVAADSVYGVGDIEMALRRAGKGYELGVNANHPFRSWAKPQAIAGTARQIAESLPEAAWRRLSAGDGTKGERLHDWVYLELADLDAGDYGDALTGVWTRGLLIRRKIADGDLAYFSRHGHRLARQSRHWSGWRVIAGRSRTASKPPRMNSASTTTRPVPGTAGIAMSRWSCSPLPCWPPSATTPWPVLPTHQKR